MPSPSFLSFLSIMTSQQLIRTMLTIKEETNDHDGPCIDGDCVYKVRYYAKEVSVPLEPDRFLKFADCYETNTLSRVPSVLAVSVDNGRAWVTFRETNLFDEPEPRVYTKSVPLVPSGVTYQDYVDTPTMSPHRRPDWIWCATTEAAYQAGLAQHECRATVVGIHQMHDYMGVATPKTPKNTDVPYRSISREHAEEIILRYPSPLY